jgi:glycosyltransferase involved in cell wall biosynthesis
VWWLKTKKIPIIYWCHGVNLLDPNNKIKNIFFRHLHNISNAIILYTPGELRYVSPFNRSKTFIANNTLNFLTFPEILESKHQIRKEFGLTYKKIVLFVGRIIPPKRLDLLLEIFRKRPGSDTGLVIVGSGLDNRQKELVDSIPSISYFGSVYDRIKIHKIHKMSDVFCIPGANGLGLNLAMYWGLPCIAFAGLHPPEIYYLKDGRNGFLIKDNSLKKLEEKIDLLLENKELYTQFSNNAKKIILEEANIDKMFQGFLDSIRYVAGP